MKRETGQKPEIGDWQVPPRTAFVSEPKKSKRDHSRAQAAAGKEQADRLARQKAAQDLNDAYYQHGADWHFPRRER